MADLSAVADMAVALHLRALPVDAVDFLSLQQPIGRHFGFRQTVVLEGQPKLGAADHGAAQRRDRHQPDQHQDAGKFRPPPAFESKPDRQPDQAERRREWHPNAEMASFSQSQASCPLPSSTR